MLTISLAIIACILQIWGHVRYNNTEEISPNLTSWTIWAFTSIIDTLNYSEMTGDWQKNALSITCSVSCIITWIICVGKGRFSLPRLSDYATFVICGFSIFMWKGLGLIRESNILLQADNFISFIPIFIAVSMMPEHETPGPWIIWTLSYLLGTLVVILRMNHWVELVYPLGCAVLHLLVALLSMRDKNVFKQV